MRRYRTPAAVLLVLVLAVVALPPARAGAAPADGYLPPVDAPVADPFRPPATRYGPGNRGLRYDLPPGSPVSASRDGLVVFAGPVARSLHVTVLHDDGLRTTYSFLGRVDVRRGQRVVAGQTVGLGGVGFHFGVRDGDRYLDPAALFGGAATVEVRLIPAGERLPITDAGVLGERRGVLDFLRGASGAVGRGLSAGRALLGGVERRLRLAIEDLSAVRLVRIGGRILRALAQDCTEAGAAPPPPTGRRIAVLVAGLGSSSAPTSAIDEVDTAALGYDAGDVLRASYNGGRIPMGSVATELAGLPMSDYTSQDSQRDLRDAARRLADLVEQTAAAAPGVPIDVLAHSQGGIVTRLALFELADRGLLHRLGTVVTIGTPHDGADAATLAARAGPAADLVGRVTQPLAGVDPGSTAVAQLAETSELIDELGARGVPVGVRFRTISARHDLIVPASRAGVSGWPQAVVGFGGGPTVHDALPGHPQTTRELRLALAGLPPGCRGLLDAALDATVPELVASSIDLAAISGDVGTVGW